MLGGPRSPSLPPLASPALLVLVAIVVLSGTGLAEDTGTLQGVVTIVGQESLRDGEVVVSFAGTNLSAGIATFDSDDPGYQLELTPGEYTVYAWAPVFHSSQRVRFFIEANRTTWVNLTVVRMEEIGGTVHDAKGGPVEGALVRFLVDGELVQSVPTGASGRFRDNLNPANYTLEVTKAGYRPYRVDVELDPGQVVDVDITLEAIPPDDEDEGPSFTVLMVALLIFLALGASFGYMGRQARMMRRAATEAEAKRSRDMECPVCGTTVPVGRRTCPQCDHVFQVRCAECGRSVDAGTAWCPECGQPIDL